MNQTTPAHAAGRTGPGRRQLTVELAERRYDIVIGSRLLADAGSYLAPLLRRPFTAIVTDRTVAGLHLPELERSLAQAGIRHHSIVLEPGEASKRFSVLEQLLGSLLDAGVERRDVIVALGGGVIGDLAGFAAAVLRRGIDFVQIPTTLLAQVDSSVGGKTGINTKHGKNLVGAFHQPKLVLADTALLDTLPARELRAGYAEVVKYGLIDDAPFFDWLSAQGPRVLARDGPERLKAIETSCRAKARIVAEDEREAGKRALLNLGHTFGHALEAATGYSDRLLHGEGVALGCQLAFDFSARLGLCAPEVGDRLRAHLEAVGLPTRLDEIDSTLTTDALLALMAQDKKVVGGQLTFILARALGSVFVARDIDQAEVRRFLGEMIHPQKKVPN